MARDTDAVPRFRRSDGLRIVGIPGELRVYDAFSFKQWEPSLLEDEALVELLLFCATWREASDIIRFLVVMSNVDEPTAARSVEVLIDAGVLIDDSRSHDIRIALGEEWAAHGWHEPLRFHLHTERLPKLDYSAPDAMQVDLGLMMRYLEAEAPPPNYKSSGHDRRLQLPRDLELADRPIGEVWDRQCGAAPALAFEHLGGFCLHAFGQTGVKKLPLTGRHVRKNVPSGGSRHPTEIYAIVLRDIGPLTMGIHHYEVEHHALCLISEGDHAAPCREHVFIDARLPGFDPTVVFVLTTVFERSMYRYRESRSYRVVNHDIGHVLENAALLASALGRPCYRGYSIHDSPVERLLGLDSLMESAMAYLAIG